ncbi:hypothetical protein GF351_03835 [Candidatus Woesearchaeota archaeon]|nr:hypothetical protein [Candidatus Woesearchaeota archaeon]
MKGHIKAHGHYFCSQNCIREYEKKHDIKRCVSCQIKGEHRPWYKERLYIVSLITVILIGGSYLTGQMELFDAFVDYLKLIWWAILLGLAIGGIIEYLVPQEYIQKFLAQQKKRTILYAVVFGFLMSACSHGILAIAIELYKKGASIPAVIAFLLASPWANLPITILLFGFFGLPALYFILSALVIAVITGFVYQLLDRKGWIEKGKKVKVKKGFSIRKDIKKRWSGWDLSGDNIWAAFAGVTAGAWRLAKMVVWWILIGMLLASLARAYIPQHIFMQYMGPTLLGLAVTLVLATIIEVCSEGSAPLAFEIFNQTGAFGNSFVFLMAGVATDYTEIGLIWSNIGKKTAIWLPVVTVPLVVVAGFLFNILL